MKMKYQNPDFWGKQLTIPFDGTVDIGADGGIEVSAEAGKFLNGTKDWQVLEGKESDLEEDPSDDENVEKTTNSSESEGVSEVDEEVDATQTLKDLLKQTHTELKEICKEMEFPKAEWGKLKKGTMAKYIIKQTED